MSDPSFSTEPVELHSLVLTIHKIVISDVNCFLTKRSQHKLEMLPRIAIGLLGAAFFGIALFIVLKQRRAKSCDLHSKNAGKVAVVLSVISSLIGVSLIICAILF